AGTFAPNGWMYCEGQLLPISENETLFQVIGTTYGGDGQETFALPDCRGRLPVHMGSGPGGAYRNIGEKAGTEAETLTVNQIPQHSHVWLATQANASNRAPGGNAYATPVNADVYRDDATGLVAMSPATVSTAGGSQPHSNLMPALCVHFIICLFGLFPSQT